MTAEEITHEKQRLRAAVKSQRAACSENFCEGVGDTIARALLDESIFGLALMHNTAASYISIGQEVSTMTLNLELLHRGVRLCVPRYDDQSHGYLWGNLELGARLYLGPHDIPEPAYNPEELCCYPDAGIVFVPGLVFDIQGGRLGYGAGIYDRLLKRLRPSVIKVGLAYDFQLQHEPVPQEDHDIRMDYILTETHWVDCRRAHILHRGN